MWIIFSLLSAFFSALMTILIKTSINGIDPIISLTIRSIIVTIILLIYVLITGNIKQMFSFDTKTFKIIFITAFVTFLTWLFYYLAIHKNAAFKVASIDKISIIIVLILSYFILKEKISILAIIRSILILIGTIMTTI